MTIALLRYPGKAIADDILTGDRVLDDYLAALDERLLGGAKVRALTLVELRDHLVERRDALVAEGVPSAVAAARAVEELGAPEDHAREQRRGLWRYFVPLSLTTGLGFGALMFAVDLTRGRGGLGRSAVLSVVQAVFFGLLLGGFVVFVHPARTLPGSSAARAAGPPFTVACSSALRWLGYAMSLVFLLVAVAGASAALGGPTLDVLDYGRLEGAVMAVLGLSAHRRTMLGDLRYDVAAEGFWIRRWYGRRWVPWSSVRALRPMRELKRWIPGWNYWSKVLLIEHQDPKGRIVRTPIYPDARESDRFVRLLAARGVTSA